MSLDADEEILQDFLIESGEILELLSEQLVDLEQRPDDGDLLNAIFRGFHTVKGGAGFLQLDALVDVCHLAENIFDLLRNHQRAVDADLMDIFLVVLDSVNSMFEEVRSGEPPSPAPDDLMAQLRVLSEGGDAAPAEAAPEAAAEPVAEEVTEAEDIAETSEAIEASEAAATPEEPSVETVAQAADAQDDTGTVEDIKSRSGDMTDDEFEQLLNALNHDDKPAGEPSAKALSPEGEEPFAEADDPAVSASAQGNEITEEEFEALLDKINANGDSKPVADQAKDKPAPADEPVADAGAAKAGASDEEITESEFEELLDRLHTSGDAKPSADQPAANKTAAEKSVPEKPATEKPATEKPAAAKAAKPAAAKASESANSKAAAKPAASKPAAEKAAAAKPPAKGGAEHKADTQETTVRVDTKRLDDIMNMVGELVLVRNRLVRLGLKSSDESMAKAVANLDVVTGDLQTAVMKTRMQPIKKVFGRFPRVVRDLARSLKKEVHLELKGEETDLDKNLVEALADPLVHLVRNSVDHGVEMPDVREGNGKPRQGTVVLAAEQEGDHILLSIHDDGAGMNPDILRTKAVEKGLFEPDAAERLTDKECFNLIFMPGFSTKSEISDISGRGVGMDVVKTKIAQLNGTIDIESEMGNGTQIMIKVPLTLAIMPTLMVMLGSQAFALPLVSVNEIFHLDLSKTNVVDGQEVVVIREKALPIFHLKRWLVHRMAMAADNGSIDPTAHVVVVSVGTQKVGFVVDQLIGQEEVVIKPLGKMLQGTAGMAGATITGDGRIALILDVPSMLAHYA